MQTALESKSTAFSDATEAARKTLRLLASKRVAPTPDNYRQFYCQIIGGPGSAPHASDAEELQWGSLIRELLKQLQARHSGWTAAKKREGLERVLTTASPKVLFQRVESLTRSWSRSMPSPGGIEPDGVDTHVEAADDPDGSIIGVALTPSPELAREWLTHALECLVQQLSEEVPHLAAHASALAARVREADNGASLAALGEDLQLFWCRLEASCKDRTLLRQGLLRLLRLLVDNVQELLSDDRWILGQLEVVRRVLADPGDIQLIEAAERSIKEIVFKQGVLKKSLNEAKTTLKDMVSRFIHQLGEMSRDAGAYEEKLDLYAQTIRQTDDIQDLNALLDDLLMETRKIQHSTARSRNNIIAVHERAEAAERKVRELEAELAHVSEMVREDQLTGILNRRGLDDAFEREISRAERQESELCVALLDIDNFKRLNDTHGHQAGDQALVHLVGVVKSTVRPHDVIARYGGEEFMILLPNTRLDEAVEIVTRLQRSLTKHFFLLNNERLLITFSAGVALYGMGETRDALVNRADRALYRAKKAGKNRVFTADCEPLAG